ncbi:uncharacterized protein RCO7_11677 [Rhynchosporium graminicola]|uniref:Uncharacterized protein n=1 Tax=Rhynchosporium graminicola TaxID=2792576 RepID=A0A1E1KY17_9HELO|nr:uncharacterized protein RCO7_11677 [Rhynchosporium commune]
MSKKPSSMSVLDLGGITRLPNLKPGQLEDNAVVAGSISTSELSLQDIPNISDMGVQALTITQQFPSIWFVNFPPELDDRKKAHLAGLMDDMLHYRSWASLQWWTEVFKNVPSGVTQDPNTMKAQSRELARAAYSMLKSTSWLQQINNDVQDRTIECKSSDFHAALIHEAIIGYVSLTPRLLQSLEPVLMAIVSSLDTSGGDNQARTLVMEKYEYVSENDSIKAYIRLVAFEVTESFYNIPEGKSGQQQWIKCSLKFLNYEALFDMEAWKASDHVRVNTAAMHSDGTNIE